MDNLFHAVDPNADRAPVALAIMWTWSAICIIIVGVRIFTRVKIVKRVGLDDWFIVASLILTLIFCSLYTVSARDGGSKHIGYLSTSQRSRAAKLSWIAYPFSVMSIISGKVSVAILILRMLIKVQRWQRWVLHSVIVSVTVVGIVICIVDLAHCSPPRALWTPSMDQEAHCWSPRALMVFNVLANVYLALMDWVLSILPITVIWKLQMRLKKKIELCILLGLGVLASVCASYKISKIPGAIRPDFTWNGALLFIWMMNETAVVIVAASIPTIQPFVVKYWRTASQTLKQQSLNSHDTIEPFGLELRSVPKHNEASMAGALHSKETLLPERAIRVSRRYDVEFSAA